jgi:hypothetical protein
VTLRRRALVTAAFVLLAGVNSYPLVTSLNSSIGAHGDAYFSVWRLAWVAHQVLADPAHVFDGNIFYPEHTTLAYSDAMLLPSLALAPLHWIGCSPVAVYNITLLGAFVSSGLAAYALVRHLTGSTAAGFLGGVIFAFSPYRMQHFDHLELQFAFWIPMAVLAWHRAVTTNAAAGYAKVAVLVAAQVLSCIYYGVFLLSWLAVVTAVGFIRQPGRLVRAGALMLLPPLLVLGMYSIPYLEIRKHVGDRGTSEIASYSATAADFLSAPAGNRLYGWTDELGANERHLFPGAVALLLAIVGVWPPLDRRRWLHLAGLCFALLLAIGFNGPLYRWLYDSVLPYRGLRVPARAAILVLLGTSVLAGYGLARALSWRAGRFARLTAALVVALTCLEYLTAPQLVPVILPLSPWYRWLRMVPDAVVFEWPVTVPWRLYILSDVEYMYRSLQHWRPLLNGYSGYFPTSYLQLLLLVRSFPDTDSLKELQERGATILIVHEVEGSRPSYDYAFERLVRDPKVRVIAIDSEDGRRIAFFRLLPAADARVMR